MPVRQIPGFTGEGDAFLTWDENAQNFAQQDSLTRDITLTITSTATTDKTAIINPSRKPSNPSAVIVDGTFYTDLSAAVDINTVAELLQQIKDEPIYLLGIKVSSNNDAIGNSSMIWTKKDVFKPTAASKKFTFSRSQSQFANNNKIFDVKMPKLLLSNGHELSVTIPKRIDADTPTTVSFILQFGVALSTATALENKAIMAGAN